MKVKANKKALRKTRNRQWPLMTICTLVIVLSCALPMYLLYLNNITEMTFVSILKPVSISVLAGLVLFFVLQYVFQKNIPYSCLFSSATMLLFLNFGAPYSAIRKVAGPILAIALTLALFIVALVLIWCGLRFLRKKGSLRNFVSIALIVLVGLVFINTIPVAGEISSRIEASISVTPPPPAAVLPEKRQISLSTVEIPEEVSLHEFMPNIFYFVLDEYAAFDVAQKYYQYDNSGFYDFLIDSGFNVSTSSRSKSTATQICMADVVTLNYLSDENRNLSHARKALNNALLYQELRELGYSLYQMSTGTYVFKGIPSLRNESEFVTGEPETEDGTTVTEIARDRSILSVLSEFTSGTQEEYSAPSDEAIELLESEEILDLARHGNVGTIKNRLSVFDYFDNAAGYSEADKIVIFSYICCPHVPFIFEANGAPAQQGHRSDWRNPKYYLQQYQYVTARMQRIVKRILEENPNCIIIIQSDHGVRWHTDCSQPHTFEITPDDEKHILNAVYCCGRMLDIEGLSATNTMRLILSQFGLDYPLLLDLENDTNS